MTLSGSVPLVEFKEGDCVLFPDPVEGGKETVGTFHGIAVGQPIAVPAPGGGTRMTDAAWVSREDGTTARVPYTSLRPWPDARED